MMIPLKWPLREERKAEREERKNPKRKKEEKIGEIREKRLESGSKRFRLVFNDHFNIV